METEVTSDLIERTVATIRERGWATDLFMRPTGEVCLLGAFNVAAGRDVAIQDALTEKFARSLGLLNCTRAMSWNDEEASEEMVYRRLRSAIATRKKREAAEAAQLIVPSGMSSVPSERQTVGRRKPDPAYKPSGNVATPATASKGG